MNAISYLTFNQKFSIKKTVLFCLHISFWLPIIFLSLLLVWNTLPYFSFSPKFSFIKERLFLYQDLVWRICFYIHIAAGVFCIITSLIQFSGYILKIRRKLHIVSGKIYVIVVLLLSAPTGLYMSFFAKGTTWEKGLFVFMALAWFLCTFLGFKKAVVKDFIAHRAWMIRSYSLALTAVSFRVYHIVFYYLDFDHLYNYEISLWISVFGNLAISELLIFIRTKKYIQSF